MGINNSRNSKYLKYSTENERKNFNSWQERVTARVYGTLYFTKFLFQIVNSVALFYDQRTADTLLNDYVRNDW